MGATQSGAIYQFKVALIGITPPIWRRVQVTGDYTLAQLHRVLQVVMGWENYHLYMFRTGNKEYGPPDPDGFDDLGLIDAKRIRLTAVMPQERRGPGQTFGPCKGYACTAAQAARLPAAPGYPPRMHGVKARQR